MFDVAFVVMAHREASQKQQERDDTQDHVAGEGT
jgi:hypothetical protein